ncbi:hypothetical protein N9L74_06365, partial [Luminiphilus sp.]|nr:hypothetical protein [Luminiphilus sp.]
MNQTHTTSPTEGGVDQGSRPPASRHGLGALSGVFLRGLLGRVAVSIGALAMIGLMVAPAQAQLDDVECSKNYSVSGYGEEGAQKAAEADCLNIEVTLPNGDQHKPANQAEKPGPLWELEIRFVKGNPSPFLDGYTGYWVDKTPEVDPINVEEDLVSFSRWTSDANGNDAGAALYTLTKGTTTCTALQGGEQTLLRFKDQVSLVCQIGEVTGKESNVWDNTVKLKWKTPEACKANTALFFGGVEAKLNTDDGECDRTQLRNYDIPGFT